MSELLTKLETVRTELNRVAELAKLIESEPSTEVHRLLNEVYSLVFIEAVYDPDSDDSQKFAQKLWPLIKQINAIVKFRE